MEPVLRRFDQPVTGVSNASVVPFRAAKSNILPFSTASELLEIEPSASGTLTDQTGSRLSAQLHDILRDRALSAVFQPIIRLDCGKVAAYEGLIRGPKNHPLHSPYDLFKAARKCNLTAELEKLCRQVILSKYVELGLPGKIFLNISPQRLMEPKDELDARLEYLGHIGISPERIVLELTEHQATFDYDRMRRAVERCRKRGFQIAIDDLGEGFSSLRLWSEIRPDYVKIDMHFIQGMEHDPVKLQFVQSIQLIAAKSGTVTIAEGIETEQQMLLLQQLGVACGQGYHIERPNPHPTGLVSADLAQRLRNAGNS
jgi:EAL domain-containing protein (putative c-di-GMP-specific phosphodiesterase class I)